MEVSVCMLCYNHEKYVAKAIESVLSQKTNFDFEILIYDDASTDNSQAIIKQYEKKYPNLIKPYYQKHNQYQNGNTRLTYEFNIKRAQGKYIAIIECDDLWQDENKLQYQYNFLENHKEYLMHVHSSKIIDSNGCFTGDILGIEGKNKVLSLENDMRKFYPTASKFFAKKVFDVVPEYYYVGLAGDLPMMLLILSQGNAFYEGLSMSSYRIGVNGSANNRFNEYSFEDKKKYYEKRVILFKEFNKYTNYKFQDIVLKNITFERNQIIQYCNGLKQKVSEYIKITKTDEYKILNIKYKIKIFFTDFFPFYTNLSCFKNKILSSYCKVKNRLGIT